MAKEIAFESGNFQRLVTSTLTLDPVILHTVVHHSSTFTYMPISLKSKTDGRTDIWDPLY